MLNISQTIVASILRDCEGVNVEQGWLLGCKKNLNHIDCLSLLSPIYADDNCYIMNSAKTVQQIREWAESGICAIGFIHSHTNAPWTLSKADSDSAKSLLKSLKLPFFYVGIASNRHCTLHEPAPNLFMYRVLEEKYQNVVIKPIRYRITHK